MEILRLNRESEQEKHGRTTVFMKLILLKSAALNRWKEIDFFSALLFCVYGLQK